MKLELGQVVMTQGIVALLEQPPVGFSMAYLHQCLKKHASGDWGCCGPEDWETNDDAVKHGDRVLSSYPINPLQPCAGFGANTIWIITECDRSVTTFLLPDEY
jgi:hypothetical protein